MNKSSKLLPLILFLLALAPRLFGLDIFLTSDEHTNIFLAGSDVIAAFLKGDFRGTYWHFYPGVTMSWLSAIGMGGQYLLEMAQGHRLPPFNQYIYHDILDLLIANRWPHALLTAAFVPCFYSLARGLLPSSVALLGALFLACDPFFLTHSRVAHGDAPVAVFMSLSALALFVYFKQDAAYRRLSLSKSISASSVCGTPVNDTRRKWLLILSAICGGLAALTKAPGQFMAPFVILLTLLYALPNRPPTPNSQSPIPNPQLPNPKPLTPIPNPQLPNPKPLTPILIWGLVSLATFIALWPAMWVEPIGTLQRMLDETFGKVNEGHLVYFFGQPTLDPGRWFYPYVIPFRLTPITLLGLILSLIMLFRFSKMRTPTRLLWLYVITLLLFGTLSPKKQDRYLLPLFPMLDLLAAVGWLGLLELGRSHLKNLSLPASLLPPTLLLLLHAIPIITHYPYYLTYFNPLMGGPQRAAQTTLMGWGEGMEQAAAYLNQKPHADQLHVAATPSQTLLPYFVGTGENFYTNDIPFRADYVVLYLAQRQRLAPSPEIVRYFEAQTPETVIHIQGVPYLHIYRHPRRILSDMPPQATPINIGLGEVMRLAGYTIQPPRLTLYWHALSEINTDYTISVRATNQAGERLYQQDSWPLEGLLPTSTWRADDYVADVRLIELSDPAWQTVAKFEIVVYGPENGQTVGPPIGIPYKTFQP